MEARLVHIEGRRRIATLPLRQAESRIGRDPTSDVILDFARVSRHHAVIQELGERHTITDAGSTNGTTVNGRPVGQTPVLLEPGDVVELSEEIALLYEVGPFRSSAPWLGLAAAMVLLLAVAAGLLFWQRTNPDDVMAEAASFALEGQRAAAAGDLIDAKAHLQRAAGILFQHGELDDVDRANVMRVAMERLSERLAGSPDLWQVFRSSLEASAPVRPEPDASGERGCRLDEVPVARVDPCLRERIELVLIELRQDPTGIPEHFPEEVGHRLIYEYELLVKSFERGHAVVPMLRQELEKARMPPLLHYLALIESGYDPGATSIAKAAGLWQFMPATARRYGLKVGGRIDERRDPVKSTEAAARYLRDLAFEFGGDALLLALAGYNRGENGVRRALKKLDDPFSDRSYWRLVERKLLPRETAHYVTRFVAAAVAGEGGLPPKEVLISAGY